MYSKIAALPKCESDIENFENSQIRTKFCLLAVFTAKHSGAHNTADSLKNTPTTWSSTTA